MDRMNAADGPSGARVVPDAGGGEGAAAHRGVRRWLDLDGLWALAVVAAAFVLSAISPVRADDLWGLLKGGEVMAREGRLLRQDVFTHAPLTPEHLNAQWLAQVAYYAAYRLAGLEGAVLLNAAAVGCATALALLVGWRRAGPGGGRAAAWCALVGLLVGASNHEPRAQTLAYPLFAAAWALLLLGERWRLTPLLLAAIQATWANLHGSFFLGPLLAGLLLLGAWRGGGPPARVRFLALAGGCMALATLATPYGLDLYAYVVRLAANPDVRAMATEWWPPTADDPLGLLSFLVLGQAVMLLRASRTPASLEEKVALAAFSLLSLLAVRNMIWWSLLAPGIMARHLASVLGRPAAAPVLVGRRFVAHAALAALVLGGVALSLPWTKAANPLLAPDKRALVHPGVPTAAADALAALDLPSRLFNNQGWGGYLAWRLWPRYQTLVDGRVEIHPSHLWRTYWLVALAYPGWEERLDGLGVGTLVLGRVEQAALVEAARASAAWREVYADHLAVIFTRADGAPLPPAAPGGHPSSREPGS